MGKRKLEVADGETVNADSIIARKKSKTEVTPTDGLHTKFRAGLFDQDKVQKYTQQYSGSQP